MNLQIREANREDISIILEMIKGIASYEKLLSQVEADEKVLERELFDEKNAYVLIAFVDQQVAGFALYFYNFSTFKGRKGLYLEDLFVKPEFRHNGIGLALFNRLIEIAKSTRCGRMEWVCLDWNQSAIDFYHKQNAKAMDGWRIFRLDEHDF